jgi:hypothetical protein
MRNMTEAFFEAYVECALWSSNDDNGAPLDDNYGADDIAPETLATMRADCADFYALASDLWQGVGMSDAQAGDDFWLTRNRHGTGFWDRGLGEAGAKLSDLCRPYGEFDLYIGDDGVIYA